MLISGIQKMTLLDYPGHIACTVFLAGCDFRCPYCHNYALAGGGTKPVMDDEGLISFLKTRVGLLDGVVLTGGEPLLHRGLRDLIIRIKELGFRVKLDTNGYHPVELKALTEEGLLDYAAMDIKNSPGRYRETAGIEAFDPEKIESSIRVLMESLADYEFRTTVVKNYHTTQDFEQIGAMIRGAKAYYLQQYVYRDTVPAEGLVPASGEEMNEFLNVARKYVPNACIRGVE